MLTVFQSFNSSDGEALTLWASLEIGDIEALAFYNDTRHIVFKQSWSKGNLSETDWMFYDMFLTSYFYYFQIHIRRISEEIGIEKMSVTFQCLSGCVAYNEDPDSYFYKLALNGEDLAHLSIRDGVWVADHSAYSQAVTKILQRDKTTIQSLYNYLKNYCQKLSRAFIAAGKEALSKKCKPEVYFFMRSLTPEAELRCIATGFYPTPINITLWKDEEIIMDNVLFTETLPNGDGTYQKTAILTAGWEQQPNVYCRVEHSSLGEPLVKKITAMIPTITLSVFLLCVVIGAGSHTLTVFHNINSSDGEAITLWGSLEIGDIEALALYNDTRHIVFKQSWSKGNFSQTDWKFYNMFLASYIDYVQLHIRRIGEEIGIEKMSGTLQCLSGCVAYNEDPDSYFYKLALNGEDLAHLSIRDGVWVAGHNAYSQAVTKILQRDKTTIQSLYNILLNFYQKLSRAFSVAGKEALSKKCKPEVYFLMRSWKSELRCIATGFYPTPINITLWKDKEIIMDNVLFTETLPNGDGTYQKTAILAAGWEQQPNVYCRVEHSSLGEPLVKKISIVLGAVICVAVLIWLMKNKAHRMYTSVAGRNMDRILWRRTDENVLVQN
ncbi:uncharacterized protein [Dendropsophus ebraccatus]|uniref:uncharacterized protein isoform X2 n=1 Tax=Dendropsophus ebraccatus TaxID=150705 RepID=UPI0038319AA6